MKNVLRRLAASLVLLTLILPVLAGCAETPAVTTSAETTAEKTTTVTETETETEARTTEEVTTEAETEKLPDPVTAELINFGSAEPDLLSYFTKAKYCAVEKAEIDGGAAIRVKTSNIKKSNERTPTVCFKYEELCKAAGFDPASLTEKPVVLLKVKAENVHDRMFTLTGCKTETDTAGAELSDMIPDGDGWHYVCFDFSGVKNADGVKVFRLGFEQLAGETGESVLLGEMRLCTSDEAAALTVPDTYPITEQTVDNYTIRLLQFNIQTENGNPAPFSIKSEMYRKMIAELLPDVVGMQEVTTTWRKWLDSYVFNDSYAGVGEPRSAGGEANPIYYRKDKFELVDSGTFWLSGTPDRVGSSVEGANYPRICTWVILKDKTTGIRFAHMNTHLDHNGNNDSTTGNTIRKQQMGVIIKFAQSLLDMPLFLSGDLNNRRTTSKGEIYALYKMITGESKFTDGDGTEYMMKLADSRLDAPVTVDENHTATMTKYYDETNSAYEPTREPIDYVFYNPANTEALTYETFLKSEDGLWISDHLPVFTTFRITSSNK